MRILIFSATKWSNNNSFGSSYSNIFEGMPKISIANIYCENGKPESDIPDRFFQITLKTLISNFFNKTIPSGFEIKKDKNEVISNQNYQSKLMKHIKIVRLQIYFWIREFIWKIGKWKSPELKEFLDSFNPDIIFQPLYYSNYLNNIVLFIKWYTKAPLVCYVSDDVYTMRQFSLSPLFWVDRIFKRRIIKKVVSRCEFLYVISEIQKKEYEKIFNIKCKILTKGLHFENLKLKESLNTPLKLVYTGGIGGGRWKSLAMLVDELKKINFDQTKAILEIYSFTPITKKIFKKLNIESTSFFMGGTSSKNIPAIQADADVLVHVEPINLKGRLQVRHSFSTKLVDYFHASRPIIAIGKRGGASIDYLTENHAALVASNKKEIAEKLQEIIENNSTLQVYVESAWECGKKKHQIVDIQSQLSKDLFSIPVRNTGTET